jgi:hypothetical protein
MRQRAQGIGARLRVRSRGYNGTEVELSLPGEVAFQSQPSGSWLSWLVRWYPRTVRPGPKEPRGEENK